jgi:hypothetical protein
MSITWWSGLTAGLLILFTSGAASAAERPDGQTEYRVLNGTADQTVLVACESGSCAVQPVRVTLPGRSTPVSLTTPLPLQDDFTAAAIVEVDEACGRDTGRLTVTAAPGSDLVATVDLVEVDTATCFAPAQSFGFVAELIPSTEPAVAAAGADDPRSVLSELRTVGEVTAAEVGAAAGGALVLVAVISWPTALLNSAVSTLAGRWRRWNAARRMRLGRTQQPGMRTDRWWWAAVGIFSASIISLFVDPGTGLNPLTLRLFASVVTAFSIEVVVGWVLLLLLMRRLAPSARPVFAFHPGSLLVVVAAVAFTRATSFEPGLVFGLVAGVAFAALNTDREKALEALVPVGCAFAVGMAAWTMYSFLGEQQSGTGLFISEALAAAVTAGVAALPIVLIPIAGLSGHAIYTWSPLAWTAGYVIGLASFFVVLMPLPTSWAEVDTSVSAWVAAYVIYSVLAVVAWTVARERNHGRAES